MARRVVLISLTALALILAPAMASTEDPSSTSLSKPATPTQQKRCPTGETNPDGTPVLGDCPADAGAANEAPPVNTIEDIYAAGSLGTVLGMPSSPPNASRPAEPTGPRRTVSSR